MTDRKMNPKQATTGGFDLNAFVGAAEVPQKAQKQPVTASEAKKQGIPRELVKNAPEGQKQASKRKSKEYLTQRVHIRLTDSEFQRLEEKAGLAPLSTYIRKLLQDQNVI